ncbi:MAG: M14 family metallopeptidase [Wenzhouxiangellaceae bacterium]|nr:M14 family metallopeptidase [Wenzhouxiangellaceae bacterium]
MFAGRGAAFALLAAVLAGGCATQTARDDGRDARDSADEAPTPVAPPSPIDWRFADAGIRFAGDTTAVRLNAVEQLREDRYRLTIEPEATPINPSPWYGFEVHADQPKTISLIFDYKTAPHRYWPKISRDQGRTWERADDDAVEEVDGNLHLRLDLDERSTMVFAQPPLGPNDVDRWISEHPARTPLHTASAGRSIQGRPIPQVTFGTQRRGAPLLIIVARQHPPETTSALAMMQFVDTLLAEDELAERFRNRVRTLVFPMANPDGVVLGNWRGNARGIDLNRDWGEFTQPETRAIRDAIARALATARPLLAVDFHSTRTNVLYTISDDPALASGELLGDWLDELMKIDEGRLDDKAFAPVTPVFKNWIFKEYGVPAVTYEVSDALVPAEIERIATEAAEALMRLVVGEPQLPGKAGRAAATITTAR